MTLLTWATFVVGAIVLRLAAGATGARSETEEKQYPKAYYTPFPALSTFHSRSATHVGYPLAPRPTVRHEIPSHVAAGIVDP